MYKFQKTAAGWVLVCVTQTYNYPMTQPMSGNEMVAHLDWVAGRIEYYSEVED